MVVVEEGVVAVDGEDYDLSVHASSVTAGENDLVLVEDAEGNVLLLAESDAHARGNSNLHPAFKLERSSASGLSAILVVVLGDGLAWVDLRKDRRTWR